MADYIPISSDSDDHSNSHNENKKHEAPQAHRKYNMESFLFNLHEELIDFYDYMRASPQENEMRKSVIRRVEDLATELQPNSKVFPFGSFATNLYLPTSDIDLVIINTPPDSIEVLAKELQIRQLVSFIECIPNARIPIVKFTDKLSGTRVDVCFEVTGGLKTAALVQKFMKKFPAMRPLIFFLKYFLQWRALNDTYQGGVGSFLLQLMVISMMQLHPVRQSRFWRDIDRDMSLGSQLVSFFELYGKQFNYVKVGISVTNNGSYYSKEDRDLLDKTRPYLLSLENPLHPEIDIGKNSFAIMRVRKAFEYAYHQLIAPESNTEKFPTLLSRLVGIRDNKLRNRKIPFTVEQINSQKVSYVDNSVSLSNNGNIFHENETPDNYAEPGLRNGYKRDFDTDVNENIHHISNGLQKPSYKPKKAIQKTLSESQVIAISDSSSEETDSSSSGSDSEQACDKTVQENSIQLSDSSNNVTDKEDFDSNSNVKEFISDKHSDLNTNHNTLNFKSTSKQLNSNIKTLKKNNLNGFNSEEWSDVDDSSSSKSFDDIEHNNKRKFDDEISSNIISNQKVNEFDDPQNGNINIKHSRSSNGVSHAINSKVPDFDRGSGYSLVKLNGKMKPHKLKDDDFF